MNSEGEYVDNRPELQTLYSELYHYTTLSGHMGILTSNSLWATSYRFLNDMTEIRHLGSHLEAALTPFIDQHLRDLRKQRVQIDHWVSRNNGPRHLSKMLAHSCVGRSYVLFEGKGPTSRISFEPFITSFCSHTNIPGKEYEARNGLLVNGEVMQERMA